MAAGQAEMQLATQGKDLKPEERKARLRKALDRGLRALGLIEKLKDQLVALRAEDMPAVEELAFDRREYNRSVVDIRRRLRRQALEQQFSIAKIEAMLGEKEKGMLALKGAIDEAVLEDGDEWRRLEVQMRTYLGLLHEEAGQPLLALKQFRDVLKRLDPNQAECRRGLERLRRQSEETAPKRAE
jgi:DNA-binding transcriptional MerR regulator